MNGQHFDVSEWTAAPLQLISKECFSASAETIFESMTDPHLMCSIFPWMDRVTITPNESRQSNGLGSMRRCQFGNGMVLEEEIIGWWPPNGFAFRGIDHSHPFGMRGHVGHITWQQLTDGCHLTWKHYFDHSNPEAMREQLIESVNAVFSNLKTCFWQRQPY